MLSSPHGNLVEVSHFTISTSSAPLASGNHGFASFPTTAFGAAPFLAGHSTLQTGSAVAPACSGPGLVDIKHCRSFFSPWHHLFHIVQSEWSGILACHPFGGELVKRLLGAYNSIDYIHISFSWFKETTSVAVDSKGQFKKFSVKAK